MTAKSKHAVRPFVNESRAKIRRDLLALHQRRAGRAAIYSEKACLLLVRLVGVQTRFGVVEADLACRKGLGSVWPGAERLSASCHRDYLSVNALAIQATGYVPWILLTSPSRVQKVRQAFAAGMPTIELRLLVRRLGRGAGKSRCVCSSHCLGGACGGIFTQKVRSRQAPAWVARGHLGAAVRDGCQ